MKYRASITIDVEGEADNEEQFLEKIYYGISCARIAFDRMTGFEVLEIEECEEHDN